MNILTFDLEEWYVYTQYDKGPKEYYLPIIEKYLNDLLQYLSDRSINATFFCLGKVAETFPNIIRLIDREGHEIGCHSHLHRFITKLNPQDFYEDTKQAIESLENVTGKKILSYRAPAFSITESNVWAFDVLAELGITRDCSIFPAKRSFGGFPSFKTDRPAIIDKNGNYIKEFPINIGNVWGLKLAYSGGGYFRLVPYVKVKSLIGDSDYVMCYFHIRDFDAYQKRVISHRYFQSYYGIKGAFDKIKRLINDFDFINIEEADKRIDWKNVTTIHL